MPTTTVTIRMVSLIRPPRLGGAQALSHQQPVGQGDALTNDQQEQGGARHYPKPAGEDEHHDHNLARDAPECGRIHHHEARNRYRRGRREECVHDGRELALVVGKRHQQKGRAHGDHEGKAAQQQVGRSVVLGRDPGGRGRDVQRPYLFLPGMPDDPVARPRAPRLLQDAATSPGDDAFARPAAEADARLRRFYGRVGCTMRALALAPAGTHPAQRRPGRETGPDHPRRSCTGPP